MESFKKQIAKNSLLDEIRINKDIFEFFEKKVLKGKNYQDKLANARKAVDFALKNATSYYSSEIIEQFYREIANKYTIDVTELVPKKNSFLHVVTRVFSVGGHSRVVERWIKNSEGGTHSVVFLDQKISDVPQLLRENVEEKSGELFDLSKILDPVEKGLALRRIGMDYEYVILHVHMDDFTPIVAFGNEEFTRPIIFINHADHQFWLGGCVSDIVINLRMWGEKLNIERRGVSNNILLEIPIETKSCNFKNVSIREIHGISPHEKLILTIGNEYKYGPSVSYDFIGTIRKILRKHPDTKFLAIGPSPSSSMWKIAEKVTEGKIKAIGTVPYENIFSYIQSCDLYLDSFPFFGGTTLIDVILSGAPALSLSTPSGQSDYVRESVVFCEDEEQLMKKASIILNSKEHSRYHCENASESLLQRSSVTSWQNKLSSIIEKIPQTHKVYCINPTAKIDEFDILLCELAKNIEKPNKKRKLLMQKFKREIFYIQAKINKNLSKR